MNLLTWEYWPVQAICVGMLAAAIIDWWKFKVPNKLTFPIIISGWVLGLLNNFELVPGGGQGGIGAAVVGTLVGCALLIPMYAIGGMGAGDVKITMGFCSWIGAYYGMPEAFYIIFWAFCLGSIAGGVIALGMIAVRGKYGQNLQNVREILGDFAQSSSVVEVHDKANKRRPRWHRLPYGVPLCIGFVGYLVYLYSA
jgi:prepilin peptidase CpaA